RALVAVPLLEVADRVVVVRMLLREADLLEVYLVQHRLRLDELLLLQQRLLELRSRAAEHLLLRLLLRFQLTQLPLAVAVRVLVRVGRRLLLRQGELALVLRPCLGNAEPLLEARHALAVPGSLTLSLGELAAKLLHLGQRDARDRAALLLRGGRLRRVR